MPNGEAAAKSITSIAGFGTSRYREVMAGWIPPRLRLLLGADLDEVTPESLMRLVGLPEDQDLEFKRQRYGSGDSAAKKTALDLAAMANASGGLIVIGIDEDGTGHATRVVPDSDPSDFVLWIHQVIAARVSPVLPVSIRPVSVDDGRVHFVSINPSTRRPHAVSVEGDNLRYPIRSGTTRRYLSEPEVADFYYRRLSGAATIQEKIYNLHGDAKSLSSTADYTEDAAWLVLSVVPELPGNHELEKGIERRWQQWVNSTLQDLPACEPRSATRASVGFRSIELADTMDSDMRIYSLHARLSLDGSGFLLIGYPYMSDMSNGARYTKIHDEEIVVNVVNGLGVLARHSIAVGVIGDITIGAQVFAPCPIVLCQYGQFRHGMIRGSRRVDEETPIAMRSAPLEPVSTPGSAVLSLARNIVSDLFSPFGLAQPLQITPEGALDISHFDRKYHSVIRTWAMQAGIQVNDNS